MIVAKITTCIFILKSNNTHYWVSSLTMLIIFFYYTQLSNKSYYHSLTIHLPAFIP